MGSCSAVSQPEPPDSTLAQFVVSTHQGPSLDQTSREIFAALDHDRHLDRIKYVPAQESQPRLYHVIETTHQGGKNAGASGSTLEIPEGELARWIDERTSTLEPSRRENPVTRSIFVLGPTRTPRFENGISSSRGSYPRGVLPFSSSVFAHTIEKLDLPLATPLCLSTPEEHFRMYKMDMQPDERGEKIGFTMVTNFNQMDICVSISYQPIKGLVNTFLHGCTGEFQASIGKSLESLLALTDHPLLLPVLLAEKNAQRRESRIGQLWTELLEIEKLSGQSGWNFSPSTKRKVSEDSEAEKDWSSVTLRVLGVIQRSLWVECTAQILLLTIQEIQKSIVAVNNATTGEQAEYLRRTGAMLSEQLNLLANSTHTHLLHTQDITQLAQAQQSAVYNYIAQRDARVQRELAQSASQTALASKRDSSSMKGIAILTMVFLPGTYIATLFTIPGMQTMRNNFSLYWAVTLPITLAVLAAYAMYQFFVDRKHRREDLSLNLTPGPKEGEEKGQEATESAA